MRKARPSEGIRSHVPTRRVVEFFLLCALLTITPWNPAFAIDLFNDDGFEYDIRENNGELGDGQNSAADLSDACDGCWELFIDGSVYNPAGAFTLDESGREVTFPVQSMSGLDVLRRVFVPQDANFVRYLNVLTNPGTEDVTVDVANETNLGSDSSTTIVRTTSGDAVADLDDFWAITNGDSGDPVVSHLWDGVGGIDRVDVIDIPLAGDDDVDWSWDSVTVPAGETVIYMTLGTMSLTSPDAESSINPLFNLQIPQLSQNLDEATLLQIRNWAFIDTDEDGMPDGYEDFFGLDKTNASDAGSDNDMDGLMAIEEFNAFTDPTNPDTDNDGLLDGDEVNTLETNPTKADTDGDTVSDGGELNSGLDPLDPDDLSLRTVVSDGINLSLTPEAALDSTGNLHIVYSAEIAPLPPAARGGGGVRQVFYTLLADDGTTLIEPTQISLDGVDDDFNVRPQVAATASGVVYVVWQQRCCSEQLFLKVLDVSADDQDGSAADLAEIGPIPQRLLSLDGVNHAAIAVDSVGDAHVMASQRCGGSIRYYKVGPDSLDMFPEVSAVNFDTCHATVDLGVDSADNVHFVYSSNANPLGNILSAYQLFYGALNGSDGATLIEPTLLTPDDGNRVKHTSIFVDDSDFAHIVFGMGITPSVSGGEEGPAEVFYTVVDPSLDDASGDAADAETITVTPITMLTDDDGTLSWYVEARGQGNNIEITWNDGGGNASAPVFHMSLAIEDGSTTAPLLLSSTASRVTNNNYVPLVGGKALLKESVGGVVSIVAQTVFAARVETVTETGLAEVDTVGGVAVALQALDIDDLPEEAQATVPTGAFFPDGLVRVVINGVEENGAVNIVLSMPTAYDPKEDSLLTWDAINGWLSLPFTPGSAPTQIIFSLTDGGAGDADSVDNGQIVSVIAPAVFSDTDGDGRPDSLDNCVAIENPNQRDTDFDGIGNLCDADFDQNCTVDLIDLGIFRAFFLLSGDFDTDLNGDGITDLVDLGVLRQLFLRPPGPSGLPNDCQ